MNVIDWLNATADYMAADRPDVYDRARAVADLSTAMEGLRDYDASVATVSFTSYLLTRLYDDGIEEFILSRKAATLVLFQPEEDILMCAHMGGINLPHVFDLGLDGDGNS